MLSFVAVLDMSSVEFCIRSTGEFFCPSSTVDLDCWNKFWSSFEGCEVAVILSAGDLDAAIRIKMGRKPELTHEVRTIGNETKENIGTTEHTKKRYSQSRIEPIPNLHMKQ